MQGDGIRVIRVEPSGDIGALNAKGGFACFNGFGRSQIINCATRMRLNIGNWFIFAL